MKNMRIDHSREAESSSAIYARLLLLVSMVMVMLSGFIFFQTKSILTELKQEKNHALQAALKQPGRTVLSDAQQAELDRVNDAIAEIKLPWTHIFSGLESSLQEGVYVLSVEPNVSNRSITLQAVTSTVNDIFDYTSELKQQPIFKAVDIQSTQSTRLLGDDALQFELNLSW